MKKVTLFVLVMALAVTVAYGCKKKPAEGVIVEEEKITIKDAPATVDISNALSKSLCKRMVECTPGTLTEEECVTQTTGSLSEALSEKPLQISQADLDNCVKSITSCTCEEVMGSEPPRGCEFLR